MRFAARRVLSLVLLCMPSVLPGVAAQEDKGSPADPAPRMCKKGALLWHEKFEGARLIGAAFDGKWDGKANHICGLSLSADSIRLFKLSKRTLVGSADTALQDGNWHTLLWEVYGDEMVVTVDDKHAVVAKVEGLATDREHLELNTRGGRWGVFKDVKVWKAEPDDQWPRRRAQLAGTPNPK